MVSTISMMLTPILTGATASGKTSLALELARQFDLEIINADSLLVYKKFDIGTAKPSARELAQIRHHLIDIRDPEELYTAAAFKRDVDLKLQECLSRKKRALIVGGTPFYLKTLVYGLWDAPPTQPEFRASLENHSTADLFQDLMQKDSVHARKVGASDRYRIIRALEILNFSQRKPSDLAREIEQREPNPQFPIWVIDRSTDELVKRIEQRTQEMIDSGLIEETQALLETHPEARPLKAIGYCQVVRFLKNVVPPGRSLKPGVAGLIDEIQLATRQLTKAQRTFFRGLPNSQWFLFEQDRPKLLDLAKRCFQENS